jgi:MFS superfamily sulfate permease-like transporter
LTDEDTEAALLLRHRHKGGGGGGGSEHGPAPPAEGATTNDNIVTTTTNKHNAEFARILQDSRMQTQYSVPDHLKPRRRIRVGNLAKWRQGPKKSIPDYIAQFIPLSKSLRSYSFLKFRNDFIAGITVSILAIPLGMSYARLAGLPAYYGLYGSFIPTMMYPIFGTSHQLSVGPAALPSLLLAQGVGEIFAADKEDNDDVDPNQYEIYALQCTFLCAILMLAMGVFRVGFITQFLSRAVISGFISGAAIIITFSQWQHILGITIPSSNKIHIIISNLIKKIDGFTWEAFVLALFSMGFLVISKELAASETIRSKFSHIKWLRASSPIIVSAVGIILVYTLDLGHDKGGPLKVVGTIPSGFPDITLTWWTPIDNRLWTTVVSMVIVGFVQSISISKRLGYRRGYEVDPSQELIALGLANLMGGIFQAYPTFGAIGQTAVNDEIGTFFLILLILLFCWLLWTINFDDNDMNNNIYNNNNNNNNTVCRRCLLTSHHIKTRSRNGHGQRRDGPCRHAGHLGLDTGV